MDTLFSCHLYKKNLGIILLFVMLLELIIGGFILPYQESQRAQAVADVIGGPSAWPKWAADMAANAVKIGGIVATKVGAWITAGVELWNKANIILKEALKIAWNILRKKLLNMIVNDITKWIKGEGTPRFVTDWQGFLKTAADKAAGQLLDKMGAGFLCDKFSFQLRLALSSPSTFDETATCTLSKAIANVDNFMTDFSKGGWKGWIAISESQNNYMGAYFMALDKKYTVMDKAAKAAKNEASSSSGFLGDKVCAQRRCLNANGDPTTENYSGSSLGWKPEELSAGGFTCDCLQWTTRTPGRVAGDALQKATGVDIDNLISAKEFAEYAASIIDAVINRVIREGVATMKSSPEGTSAGRTGPGIDTAATGSGVNISAYSKANTDSANAQALKDQQALLEENFSKLLGEEQKTLIVLNKIKASQNNSLNTLTSLLQSNCALPTGVSVSAMTSPRPIVTPCTTANTTDTNCSCIATTVENVKLSASGVGEATLKKTTTQNYTMTDPYDTGSYSCQLDGTTISYQVLSTTVATEGEITTRNATITSVQSDMSKIATTITDTLDYQTKADAYMASYEDWQNGNTTAATSTTETAMNEAETKAITSNQYLLSSSSVSFRDFNNKTMTKTNDVVAKISDAMTKRGAIAGCSYASLSPPCFQVDLCNAQSTESSYQTTLDTCLNPPY